MRSRSPSTQSSRRPTCWQSRSTPPRGPRGAARAPRRRSSAPCRSAISRTSTRVRSRAREGSSPSTVRAHLTRGLAALRERLDRRAGGRDAWCAVLAPLRRARRAARADAVGRRSRGRAPPSRPERRADGDRAHRRRRRRRSTRDDHQDPHPHPRPRPGRPRRRVDPWGRRRRGSHRRPPLAGRRPGGADLALVPERRDPPPSPTDRRRRVRARRRGGRRGRCSAPRGARRRRANRRPRSLHRAHRRPRRAGRERRAPVGFGHDRRCGRLRRRPPRASRRRRRGDLHRRPRRHPLPAAEGHAPVPVRRTARGQGRAHVRDRLVRERVVRPAGKLHGRVRPRGLPRTPTDRSTPGCARAAAPGCASAHAPSRSRATGPGPCSYAAATDSFAARRRSIARRASSPSRCASRWSRSARSSSCSTPR